MRHRLIAIRNNCIYWVHDKKSMDLLKVLLFLGLFLLFKHASATGVDIAAGAADDLVATETGTGTKILYGVEFFLAIVAMIIKRSFMGCINIFVIALFIGYVTHKFLS